MNAGLALCVTVVHEGPGPQAGSETNHVLDSRQRTRYLVLAVVIGHVILISAQVNARPGTKVLEAVIFSTLSEVQRLVTAGVHGVRGAWNGYVSLRDVRAENSELRRDLADLELRLQEQNALAQRARSLQQLLELRETVDLTTLSARVIAADATPWFRTVTVDRGANDGVHQDLAVIAPRGVVGRVVGAPGARAAMVQLLIDRNAAAGAIIERTRAAGVVVGVDDEATLRMDYVSNLEDVQEGDAIVTSGTDGIYPKGYLIGRITAVERGTGLYKAITVDPVVDFTQLEDLLIVMTEERLASAAGDRMRATRIGLAVAVALAAQTTLTFFVSGTGADVDFPLIAVVFAALSGGPVVGLWTGTAAGLAQDVLSGGIVGVSGLAKSLVGFAVGVIGAQFMVTGVGNRLLMLGAATMAHAVCFLGIYTLIAAGGPMAAWTDVLVQAVANALFGIVAISVVEQAPRLWERARLRRGGFATRRWRTN